MYLNFHYELNDFLIRKHFKQFGMVVGYYDICETYNELMDHWESWVESYMELFKLSSSLSSQALPQRYCPLPFI